MLLYECYAVPNTHGSPVVEPIHCRVMVLTRSYHRKYQPLSSGIHNADPQDRAIEDVKLTRCRVDNIDKVALVIQNVTLVACVHDDRIMTEHDISNHGLPCIPLRLLVGFHCWITS